MMVRLATIEDASELFRLNEQFNGAGETTLEHIRLSLCSNTKEIIAVAEEDRSLVGFVCMQLKKSFCYDAFMPEMTEVFVQEAFRRRKIASELIAFVEAYCKENFPCERMELLTGGKNFGAQAFYHTMGYAQDGELHFAKRFRFE